MLSRRQRADVAAAMAAPLAPGRINKLEAARLAAKLTQVELAAQLGTEQTRISLFENGKYTKLSLEQARTFATFFGVSIEALFPPVEDQQ